MTEDQRDAMTALLRLVVRYGNEQWTVGSYSDNPADQRFIICRDNSDKTLKEIEQAAEALARGVPIPPRRVLVVEGGRPGTVTAALLASGLLANPDCTSDGVPVPPGNTKT
jgi:hypothetical protein